MKKVPEHAFPASICTDSSPKCFVSPAFTLIELLTVIAIIGILAGILIPVVGRVRDTARASNCVSNLRQLHAAVILYANDHRDNLPLAYENATQRGWDYALGDGGYTQARKENGKWVSQVFGCPRQRTAVNAVSLTTYGMNGTLTGSNTPIKLAAIEQPTRSLLMADGTGPVSGGYNIAFWQSVNKPSAAHGDKANLLFVDGHVQPRLVSDILLNRWPAGSDQWVFWTGKPD